MIMNYSSCLRPCSALFRLSDPLILRLLLSQADGTHYNKQIVIDKMIGETGRVGGVAPVDRGPPVYWINLIAGRLRPWADMPHGRAFDIYFISISASLCDANSKYQHQTRSQLGRHGLQRFFFNQTFLYSRQLGCFKRLWAGLGSGEFRKWVVGAFDNWVTENSTSYSCKIPSFMTSS